MTDDELKALVERVGAKLSEQAKEQYERSKSESKEKYNALVAKWGRRAVNTVLVLGSLGAAFGAGYLFALGTI